VEIRILEERANPLLKRHEYHFEVSHATAATPSRDAVRGELSKLVKAPKDRVIIERMGARYGTATTRGDALVYETADAAKSITRGHILIRNGLKEKEGATAPAAAPPAESKPAEAPAAPKPETPKDEAPAPKGEARAEHKAEHKSEHRAEHKPEHKADHSGEHKAEEKPEHKPEHAAGEKAEAHKGEHKGEHKPKAAKAPKDEAAAKEE
jgi:small subunit ribosomal protein S24e